MDYTQHTFNLIIIQVSVKSEVVSKFKLLNTSPEMAWVHAFDVTKLVITPGHLYVSTIFGYSNSHVHISKESDSRSFYIRM